MARAKNRFGLAGLQTHLNEVVYRRPWPIRLDRRLVPLPLIASPTPSPPVPSRTEADVFWMCSR